MEKKNAYLVLVMIAILGSFTLSGCSSSEVSENGEVSADELPVVDAQTDALPEQMDQPAADGAVATSVDGQAPEASVDMPQADPALAEAPVSTDVPANSPSVDAPPSMNETAPVATAAAAPENHSSGEASELYEVQSGDTLMKIAFKVYGDVYQWRKVLEANADRIADPARLVKGTQLRVDNAPSDSFYNGYERYLIKSGDTLGLISNDVYGTKQKWKQLWKMNDGLIKDPNRIYAGFFLRYTMTEQERQDSERTKSMQSTPLAGASEEDSARNPSSVEEAKAPVAPATTAQ